MEEIKYSAILNGIDTKAYVDNPQQFRDDLREYLSTKTHLTPHQTGPIVIKAISNNDPADFMAILRFADELADMLIEIESKGVTRELVIRPVTEHATCNACLRPNYIPSFMPIDNGRVNTLYELVIGHQANRLCPECLAHMTGLIATMLEESR